METVNNGCSVVRSGNLVVSSSSTSITWTWVWCTAVLCAGSMGIAMLLSRNQVYIDNHGLLLFWTLVFIVLASVGLVALVIFLLKVIQDSTKIETVFTSVFSHVPRAIFLVDKEGMLVSVNNDARLFCHEYDDKLQGLNIVEVIGRERDIEAVVYSVFKEAMENGNATVEFYHKRSRKFKQMEVSKFFDTMFIASLSDSLVQDVKIPVKGQHAVRRCRLGHVLDDGVVGYAVVDEDMMLVDVNNTLTGWLGLDVSDNIFLKEICLRDILDVQDNFPKDDVDIAIANLKLPKGDMGVLLYANSRADNRGIGLWGDLFIIPVESEKIGMIWHELDIKQKLEKAKLASKYKLLNLYDSPDLMNVIIDNDPVAVVIMDFEGVIQYANQNAFTLLSGDCIGQMVQSYVDHNCIGDYQKHWENVIEHKTGHVEEELTVSLISKDTSRNHDHGDEIFMNIRFEYSLCNDVPCIIAYMLDKSESRFLEKQFIQSQKMQAIGQLAGGVAHDFNNILTAILGHCELLLLNRSASDHEFSDINQIHRNAKRATSLVKQLLAFSRQQTFVLSKARITETMTDLSHLLNRLIGEKVLLKIVHSSNLWDVSVDVSQLEQVIVNLVVNARDAMPDGGEITIRTENISVSYDSDLKDCSGEKISAGSYVGVYVTDTGEGISDAVKDKIFDPFFTTKEVGKGSGLGLSTVYGIIRQLKGFVSLDSEISHGTTFLLYIPKFEGTPNKEEDTHMISASGSEDLSGTGNILLIEDEEAVREFVMRALRMRGYDVTVAETAEHALSIVESKTVSFDLLLSDVVMPEMDGPTIAKKIRNIIPDIKVIFMSGYAEDAFNKSLDKDESFTFLPKPFSLNGLAKVVKDVIAE